MTHTLNPINREAGFYGLSSDSFLNRYYIVSSPETCELMASPNVVGYDSYKAMVPPTVSALGELMKLDGSGLDNVNILTILRGGLNYPIEEACSRCGIRVSDISFLSCERIIRDGVITGLDIKYEKLHTEPACTLIIGDIIASGQTLELCLNYVVDRFRNNGHDIRRVVFFTIGGTKAVRLMEDATRRMREYWPEFQGFDCVFYEGMFTVYEDKGVTGVNIPDIDFGWKGGTISPEFRKYVIEYENTPALLEKCIIYDGGARRYEIDAHREEVTDYWQRLKDAAPQSSMKEFVAEKIGYDKAGYGEWLKICHYAPDAGLEALYAEEQEYIGQLCGQSLAEICDMRLRQLEDYFANYEK